MEGHYDNTSHSGNTTTRKLTSDKRETFEHPRRETEMTRNDTQKKEEKKRTCQLYG